MDSQALQLITRSQFISDASHTTSLRAWNAMQEWHRCLGNRVAHEEPYALAQANLHLLMHHRPHQPEV